jgi:HD-GYP domain-containing protein (c-di-GMP phosphodiesterase class II)
MGIHHLVVLTGIGFLAASLHQSRKINEYIPGALRWRWLVMEGLMAFFLLGYIVELFAKGRMGAETAEFLVSSVYLGGAVFVFMIMRMSRLTLSRIKRDERRIAGMNEKLIAAYESTIEGWGRALELRDKETEGHTQRVCVMTMALAAAFPFTPEELRYIKFGALLHDIGKMGVPDSILMKDGPLTPEEIAVMNHHPEYARQMLAGIEFLRPAMDIPYCHHERWDGSGYPRGLKGEAIPLAARIFAVADVWDALAHARRYHEAWSTERVCDLIRDGSGSNFDPQVVVSFLALDFCGIDRIVQGLDAQGKARLQADGEKNSFPRNDGMLG